MPDLITLDEHRDAVLARAARVTRRAVTVPPAKAVGLVTAHDVVTAVPLPSDTNSAMDGYAVLFDDMADLPATVDVVADVPAGSSADPTMGPGQAVRIMTGAPVPTAADTIIPLEDTTLGLDVTDTVAAQVTITRAPTVRGAHVRRRGEELPAGEVLAPAGTLVTPRWAAGFIAAGITEVTVIDAPTVAVVSTGDELVPAGQPLGRGQIYDSNTTLIALCAEAAGARVVDTIHAGDTGEEFLTAMGKAATVADIVVTTGGVSVGAFDVVRLNLQSSGWDIDFVKVAMQPGKPQGVGTAPAGSLVACLPGNPVSAFVSFEAFVRPAIHLIAGRKAPSRRRRAIVDKGWDKKPGRAQLMPVVYTDETCQNITPATSGGSRSHMIGRLGAAQALALVPADAHGVPAGTSLTVWEIV